MQIAVKSCQANRFEIPIYLTFICCILFLLTLNASGENGIVKIGNPGLKKFPGSDSVNLIARSVWDMNCYNGSIYVGMGNYWNNKGPIDVWSFDADGKFKKEYTVDEEQIYIFREYEGMLFIPGMDTTESSAYGNLYIKSNGNWQKLRTIPHAFHVWDVALFEKDIYVTISSDGYSEILKSSDMGETWESVVNGHSNSDDTWFREIIALDDSLFIMGSSSSGQARAYRYINGNIEKLAIQTFPNMQGSYPQKIIRFRDGVLYIGSNTPFTMRSPSPLIFLNDFGSGVVIVEEFREKNVRDIVVRDGVCYVLTASKSDSALQGRIHSSSDLEKWTRLAEFSVSAMPYSLEILEGAAYVALGYSPESVDAEVGSIYKLELDNSPSTDSTKLPAWDIDKDGTISMSDLALVGQHLGEISTTPLEPNPDVNGDGKVDILDIVLVGKHFGEIYSLALPSEEI